MRSVTASKRRELGAKRAKCRFRIMESLENNGLSSAALADELGVSGAMVSHVINGRSHSQRIIARLRDAGVPEKYLFDPHYLANSSNGMDHDK